ncbi:MAG: ATP-binding protein [Kiritimatiellae bacterium]|nr:ATP-binding protein [Kiritimatiellia bacterium]
MEDVDIKVLLDTSARLVSNVEMSHRRYLCPQIDWDDKLICIKGPKGTGKTTLMLQHIREVFGARSERAVYVSADHLWFSSHSMLDAVEYFDTHGYTHLFIDEIHHLPEWSRTVKTIADSYPHLNIAYSGSSILKLSKGHADLSRRQAVYGLKGLSFREFLSFEGVMDLPPLRLEDIVVSHREIAGEICEKAKILPLFGKYLAHGYYPFYRGVRNKFPDRLVDVVNTVLEVDLPAIEDVTMATIRKTRKMLMVLAGSCPQQPNMSALYRELETNRNLGIKMLNML